MDGVDTIGDDRVAAAADCSGGIRCSSLACARNADMVLHLKIHTNIIFKNTKFNKYFTCGRAGF